MMDKKRLCPDFVVDPADLLPDADTIRQRNESEFFAFAKPSPHLILELTDVEQKAVVPWLLNQLESNPTPRLLAEVLRCFILKQPLCNLQSYQTFVSMMRFDKVLADERQRQTEEWNTFIDKPVVFNAGGYKTLLTCDNRDVTIIGQPNFTVKVSNGKQSAMVLFGSSPLNLWRRKVVEEAENFKTTYGTEAEKLIMAIPEGIEVTLVRDVRETMRPIRVEDGTGSYLEAGLQIGVVLSPVTVPLQLLMLKQ